MITYVGINDILTYARYVEIIKDKERNSGRRKFTKKNKTSDGGDIGTGSKKKKQKT